MGYIHISTGGKAALCLRFMVCPVPIVGKTVMMLGMQRAVLVPIVGNVACPVPIVGKTVMMLEAQRAVLVPFRKIV